MRHVAQAIPEGALEAAAELLRHALHADEDFAIAHRFKSRNWESRKLKSHQQAQKSPDQKVKH
jgi:hypothetical protein